MPHNEHLKVEMTTEACSAIRTAVKRGSQRGKGNTLRMGVTINQTHDSMYCQERMQVCRWFILSVPYLNILCSPSFVGKASIIAGQPTDQRYYYK